MHSKEINELATALAKAQGQMKAASKDAVNPHLRNTYATLSSYIEAAREALSTNDLAFSQILSQGNEGVVLETLLMHSSGQWLKSEVLIRVATDNRGINGAQALGSALTYYKRYALSALLGISASDEDDDGNGVEQPAKRAATPPTRQEAPRQVAKPNVDQSTGEVMPPQTNGKPKAQQATKPADTEKDKNPTNGQELLEMINQRVLVTYRDVNHLRNAIRQELENKAWDWPAPGDRTEWREAYVMAKRHADNKTTEKAPVEEKPAF